MKKLLIVALISGACISSLDIKAMDADTRRDNNEMQNMILGKIFKKMQDTLQNKEAEDQAIELINFKVNVNFPITNLNTLLHFAIAFNLLKLASELIKKGSNLELQNNDGDTPLHIAAKLGHLKAAQLLLDMGASASLDLKNKNGQTPLAIAISKGDEEMAILFEKAEE